MNLFPWAGGDPIPLLKEEPAGRPAGKLRHRLAVLQRLGPSLPVDRQRRLLVRPRPAKPQRREGQRGAGHGEAARSGRHPLGCQAQLRGASIRRSTWGPWGRRRRTRRGRHLGKWLLERAGLERQRVQSASRRSRRAEPRRDRPRYDHRPTTSRADSEVGRPNRRWMAEKEERSAPSSARIAASAPGRPIGPGSSTSTAFRTRPPRRRARQRQGRTDPPANGLRPDGRRRRRAGLGDVHLEVDEAACRRGRVLSVHGLASTVRRRRPALPVRHPAAAEDPGHRAAATWWRPATACSSGRSNTPSRAKAFIERVEPRHGTISAAVRGRQHVLVANVDQLLIVASAAEPRLKPNLIDRLLVAAEKGGVRPVICINKIDLVDPADLQPLVGVYSRMGYRCCCSARRPASASSGSAALLAGRASVVAGQSGVGKSSLLNAVDPACSSACGRVSADNEKGRHTTTTARLLPLACGGYVVDTPGMRQFELWDVIPEEVAGYFRDLRPYVSLCRFPDCTHTHEDRLRREGRRGRRPARRAAVRKLLPFAERAGDELGRSVA